mmetsp:Transcript_25760/g.71958  ORF Transcript_25760/g.71958 Transcript_25760/m.71958 type:complete len:341 (+) Transcript_25760:177-1199(+)
MNSFLRPSAMMAMMRRRSQGGMRAVTASQGMKYDATTANFSTTTPPPKFEKVGVIGLGLMGHGICQTIATAANNKIIAYEQNPTNLQLGKERIESSLNQLITKNKMTSETASLILGKITFTTDMDALYEQELIIEAIIENLQLKQELYSELGRKCNSNTIFASNTSSLPIVDISVSSQRPNQFVGIHFFNPVQKMKLVEVIRTEYTDPVVFDAVFDWVRQIGKVPVSCGDTPGFIVNRLLVPSLLQAMLMVDRDDATIADIDLSMQLGAGHPMGPLHLADYIGLDTCLYIVQGWVEKYPDEPAFVIPESLVAKVAAGDLGRKTGRGFYVWDGDKRGDPAH